MRRATTRPRPALACRPLVAALCLATTLAIHAGQYQPPQPAADGWPVADAAKLGWNTATLATLEDKTADGTYKKITSVVVADHGRLVYEHYFNDGSADLLNDIRSASKSLTARVRVIEMNDGEDSVDGRFHITDGAAPDRRPHEHGSQALAGRTDIVE